MGCKCIEGKKRVDILSFTELHLSSWQKHSSLPTPVVGFFVLVWFFCLFSQGWSRARKGNKWGTERTASTFKSAFSSFWLERIPSALRINRGREPHKDYPSLPSDPEHSLKVVIFLTVTGFCWDLLFAVRRHCLDRNAGVLFKAPWLHFRVDSLTTGNRRLNSILTSPCWGTWGKPPAPAACGHFCRSWPRRPQG